MMNNNKLSVLLVVAAVAGTAKATINVQEFNECKVWKMCCDDGHCLNNCQLKPDYCANYAHMLPTGTSTAEIAVPICESTFSYDCSKCGAGCGDPHFQTWGADNGNWFDFHGECDLNFLHAPSFGDGIGMDIHVRTKIRNDFSYIEAAAVKIGDDVLVVGGFGDVVFNGVAVGKYDLPKTIGSFPMTHDMIDEATHNYSIFIGEHENLLVKSFKDYVSVKFDNAPPQHFRDSTGLLGDFLTGTRYARDGYTVLDNDIEYGMEWQVRPQEEPQLFQSPDLVPQYPQKCNMPPMTADGRRLAEAKVSDEVAQAACASLKDEAHKRMCVYDVQATGDLSMAQAGAF